MTEYTPTPGKWSVLKEGLSFLYFCFPRQVHRDLYPHHVIFFKEPTVDKNYFTGEWKSDKDGLFARKLFERFAMEFPKEYGLKISADMYAEQINREVSELLRYVQRKGLQ